MTRAKMLIAGTALLTILALPAFAAESSDAAAEAADYTSGTATVLNGQVNLGEVWSQIDSTVTDVDHDVSLGTSSVGNSAEIITMSNTHVTNNQTNLAVVGAQTNATVQNVGGDVSLGATAVCNGASVSTDPDITAVKSRQICGALDPSASVNANVRNVTGGVGIAAVSVSNQLEIDTNAKNFPVKNYQENRVGSYASVNATIANVGSAAASATAVGNTAQIIHY